MSENSLRHLLILVPQILAVYLQDVLGLHPSQVEHHEFGDNASDPEE